MGQGPLNTPGLKLNNNNNGQAQTHNNRSSSSSRSRSGSRASANRDKIRCYKCREYDYFSKDCPTSQIEKESEQIQQMYNIDEEQTAFKGLATDTYDNLNRINSVDKSIVDHLNL